MIMKQSIIISKCLNAELDFHIKSFNPDKVFIIVDNITEKFCLPRISDIPSLKNAGIISICSTDNSKNINSLTHVWRYLSEQKATRYSLIINLGGGMVTDLGGFAASTFKRGLKFINIPTTLLAMVDASVGGKTGINFNGLKNEIGVFNNSDIVIIDTNFLKTLDSENICSGYAEMIKHSLISNEDIWSKLLTFDILAPNLNDLSYLLEDSIKIKEEIVKNDPYETGMRKALNFGHTIGHAFESLSMIKQSPILHGYAVAYGMICELYLCTIKVGFPIEKMRQTVSYIKYIYGIYDFSCDDYEVLYELMKHDKKNTANTINFTLLENIGKVKINFTASKEDIFESFDFIREGL